MTAFDPFAPAHDTATDRQVSYALSLLSGRDLTAHGSASYRARLLELAADHDQVRALDRHAASALIDTLTALPRVPDPAPDASADRPALQWPGVPAGQYAIVTETGEAKFYRVDRPTEGKWAGALFLKIQAGDDYYPVRGPRMANAMDDIAVDPAKAARLYGKAIGRCGLCGRTLTTEESRAYGVGPTCRQRAGW